MPTPDRDHVVRLLGGGFGRLAFVSCERLALRAIGGATLETLRLTTSDGVGVPAYLALPRLERPAPAVLYCHAHGDRYDIGREEIVDGRPALAGPYLEDLLRAGFAVLCLEMPCFGARADLAEGATAKALQWRGDTLFGRMLAEQAAGLGWLAAHRAVDADRIAALGISMGGTLAWWLAALEPRLAAAASLCCFADLDCLIGTGAHDGHGHYMTVPGLLAHCRTGQLAGLAAPRALLFGVGMRDWSTPQGCFETAFRDVAAAYCAAGAQAALERHVEPEGGHLETPAMRAKVLGFLRRSVGEAARDG